MFHEAKAGGSTTDRREGGEGLRLRSHLLPRTSAGKGALALFLLLMALAQPPVVHGIANRIEPWILGMPFLFAYLLAVYVALVGLLVWMMRKGL